MPAMLADQLPKTRGPRFESQHRRIINFNANWPVWHEFLKVYSMHHLPFGSFVLRRIESKLYFPSGYQCINSDAKEKSQLFCNQLKVSA